MATKSKTAETSVEQAPPQEPQNPGVTNPEQLSEDDTDTRNGSTEGQTTPPGAQNTNGTEDPAAGASTSKQRSKAERISASLQAIGRDVLAANPHFKAVYITANGYAFPVECDAINHAATLKNKNIETVKREQ